MKRLFCYIFALSALAWGQAVSPMINQIPTRQFGHPVSEILSNLPTQASPNLVEGRELNAPGQIAFDTSGTTPILYIADIGNNRVLAYKNPANLTNGKTADLVIGQQDLMSTSGQGPTTALSTGFSSPTGLAVDSKGNLYVADAGNNRIMRFPTPFNTPAGTPPQPDLLIGQPGFQNGNAGNQGGNCSSKTLWFSTSSGPQLTSLAIDSSGNLWTTDPLNNRVLMYQAANLIANASQPVASVVLGQNDFVTCTQPASGFTLLSKGSLVDPSGLAFDTAGNLYVTDVYSRVLFFQGPNFASQGQAALRVLGIPPPVASGAPATVYPTQYTLGAFNTSGGPIPANGVFTNGTNLFVADTPQSRIVEYDIPANWPAESTSFPSPPIKNVYGQIGFATGKSNQAQPQPSSSTFSGPFGGAFLGTQMWVADTGNNRVVGLSLNSAATYSSASVLVGQLDYIYNAPNLIVGSEVFLSSQLGSASGIVVDNSSNPPHLYVADPGNNRILGFKSALTVGAGATLQQADLVIGQPDLKTSEINYPMGLAGQPTQTGLYSPIGVAVDVNGNLYVADSGNGRVVRFPAPFNQPAGQQATANLVLGQPNFTSFIQTASANSMHSPWGLALFADDTGAVPLGGSLAVSDPTYNRVLIFKKQASGDFTSGQSAAIVLGQSSFSGTSAGTGFGSFNSPRGIASDTSDRLYVADEANGRVLEFNQAPEGSSGATSTNQLTGLNAPLGVAINASTTELWATSTNSGIVYRYPQYTTCQLSTCQPTAQLASYGPLGLAVDASGNVIVGDASNRITFYFAAAFYRNAATYSAQQPLAPGMLAILGRYGLPMSIQSGAAQAYPWPTTLSDINLTVNGTAAPIFATNGSYGSISFQVPYEAPTSGFANYIITQHSTGAVLGVGSFQMGQADPGFFTSNSEGTALVAAQNAVDNSTNTPANPVARGATIVLYLTGQGPVPNAPADGAPPSGSIPTTGSLTVAINGTPLTSSQIQYSGLGAFPGGWQINAVVPETVPPGVVSVLVIYNGIQSNIGGTTASDGISPGADVKLTGAALTTIAVK
ncbi:MAG TPA: hypothetical protein VK752_29560 [Bryobacteraceae bacterium]|nr:hypothetical protein [Bryobacteraceae bacterium]